jgi:prepilin-type processing-associated H-X9-DG protein
MAPLGPNPPVGGDPALTSYAGCHNDVESPIDAKDHGVLFLNSRIRYEDIEDGTSNTIFIGEKLADDTELGWASGTRATLRNMGWTVNTTLTPIRTSPNAASSMAPDEVEDATNLSASGRAAGKAAEEAKKPIVGGFGSKHPGGSNFGLGDGSVRFLKNTINPKVLHLLGNRADGDLLSSDQF